jgi:hypothetical protein
MSSTPYDARHQRDRRLALAEFRDGDICFRCRRPMRSWQSKDLDHVRPIARGGVDGPKRLSHSKCNRSAGAVIGNRSIKRKTKRRPIRSHLPNW